MLKPVLAAVAISVGLAAGLFAAGASAEGKAISVVAFESEARSFADTLTLRGRTEANREVEARSEIAGLIVSPPLRKGAVVKEGDVLCRLNESDRAAELAEAQAYLQEAELNAEAADRLLEKGYTAETTAKTRVAALQAARARVLRAEINMERLTIEAPFGGILETDTAELGSLLQNGSVCGSLIALDPIKVVAYVPERNVDQVQVGAEISARLITGREVMGVVSFVARSADRDTRTYLVEAETPNPDLSIRDGMTAEIEVALAPRSAHLVPQNALTLDREGALGVRTVDEAGVARFAPVEILKDQTLGAWVGGLPEKATVIVVGQEFVTDGQAVDVELADPSQLMTQ